MRVQVKRLVKGTLLVSIVSTLVAMVVLAHTRGTSKGPPWNYTNGSFILRDDTCVYFTKLQNLTCLIEGTDMSKTHGRVGSTGRCPCLPGWSGISCSIPDAVRYSRYPFKTHGEPQIREAPRRIVQALPFNIEFEMLEARFAELGDVVDVFIVLESNYTAHGDKKPLHLLQKLQSGHYPEIAEKLIHVFLDHFPREAAENGWLADNLHRDYIASHGVAKRLRNYRLDDVFFLTDADELVARETLLFLKLHDGWPEPVGFHLQKNYFGFYWVPRAGVTVHVIGGVTLGVLTRVLHHRAIWIRSAPAYLRKQAREAADYRKSFPRAQPINQLWSFGNKTHPAGYHCSWCCQADCVLTKLLSAQNGDFPRWGDYPEKTNLTYIKGIIQRGVWFDNRWTFKPGNKSHPHFAPRFLMSNQDTYKHILDNPYKNVAQILSEEELRQNTAAVDTKIRQQNVKMKETKFV